VKNVCAAVVMHACYQPNVRPGKTLTAGDEEGRKEVEKKER
jgi:hypothetical protein